MLIIKNRWKKKIYYIFIGCRLGLFFPAFLMHNNRVNLSIIDLMISLFDSSICTGIFQNILKELHIKKYYRLMMHLKYKVIDRKISWNYSNFDTEFFWEFLNKQKYKGVIHLEKYLKDAYQKYHYSNTRLFM